MTDRLPQDDGNPSEYEAHVELVIFEEENRLRERKFIVTPDEAVPIGRSKGPCEPGPDNAILTAPTVSRRHCELSLGRYSGELRIQDCKSTHGTFIEGEKLAPGYQKKILPGTLVALGPEVNDGVGAKRYEGRSILVEFKVEKVNPKRTFVDLTSPKPTLAQPAILNSSNPTMLSKSLMSSQSQPSRVYSVPDSSSESGESDIDFRNSMMDVANKAKAQHAKRKEHKDLNESSSPPDEPLFGKFEVPSSSASESEAEVESNDNVQHSSLKASIDELACETSVAPFEENEDPNVEDVILPHLKPVTDIPSMLSDNMPVAAAANSFDDDKDLELVHPSRRGRHLSSRQAVEDEVDHSSNSDASSDDMDEAVDHDYESELDREFDEEFYDDYDRIEPCLHDSDLDDYDEELLADQGLYDTPDDRSVHPSQVKDVHITTTRTHDRSKVIEEDVVRGPISSSRRLPIAAQELKSPGYSPASPPHRPASPRSPVFTPSSPAFQSASPKMRDLLNPTSPKARSSRFELERARSYPYAPSSPPRSPSGYGHAYSGSFMNSRPTGFMPSGTTHMGPMYSTITPCSPPYPAYAPFPPPPASPYYSNRVTGNGAKGFYSSSYGNPPWYAPGEMFTQTGPHRPYTRHHYDPITEASKTNTSSVKGSGPSKPSKAALSHIVNHMPPAQSSSQKITSSRDGRAPPAANKLIISTLSTIKPVTSGAETNKGSDSVPKAVAESSSLETQTSQAPQTLSATSEKVQGASPGDQMPVETPPMICTAPRSLPSLKISTSAVSEPSSISAPPTTVPATVPSLDLGIIDDGPFSLLESDDNMQDVVQAFDFDSFLSQADPQWNDQLGISEMPGEATQEHVPRISTRKWNERLDSALVKIDKATSNAQAEAEAAKYNTSPPLPVTSFLTTGIDDESTSLRAMSAELEQQTKEAEEARIPARIPTPEATGIKRSNMSDAGEEEFVPGSSFADFVRNARKKDAPTSSGSRKRVRFSAAPSSDAKATDPFGETTYGSEASTSNNYTSLHEIMRSLDNKDAGPSSPRSSEAIASSVSATTSSPAQIAANARISPSLAERRQEGGERRRRAVAVKEHSGRNIAQAMKPFMFGVAMGSIGVLGALIGLPESYFA